MSKEENKRPIIGILAQEVSDLISKKYPYSKSYIAASYVKAIEGSGARVVPIFLDKSEEYYRKIIRYINGLVLPGGNTWFYKFDDKTPKENGYLRAAEILYKEIIEINKQTEDSFPILGICLGLEVMLFIDNQKEEYRIDMGKQNTSLLTLELVENSNISTNQEKYIKEVFGKKVYFSHQFYISEEIMQQKFHEDWETISTSTINNIKFMSITESKKYPFVGLQFHPEKIYEWSKKLKLDHSQEAVIICRFFFDWLIKESQQNHNQFSKTEEENSSLICNYQKTFTAQKLNFDELYLFDENNVSLILIKHPSLIHYVNYE